MRDREAFQEVDFRAMYAPLAKWVAEISEPERIPEYIHRAFQTAMSGRPGPVVLSLPEDMLREIVAGPVELGRPAVPVAAGLETRDADRIIDVLDGAKKPLLIVGGGGWTQEASRAALDFAEQHDLPVAVSLRCQDYVDNNHPNYVGHFTIGADPTLVRVLEEADTLIVVGARLGEMTTGGYKLLVPPLLNKTLVHIHSDPNELGRVYQADVAINASSPATFAALAARPAKVERPWRDWLKAARQSYESTLVPPALAADIDLACIVEYLNKQLPADTIVCNGAGNYTAWFHKYWGFTDYRTQLAPTSGAMGYGVPAGVAAALRYPDRPVLVAAGDGCLQMSVQELATAAQYGAKILHIVVNNGIYGTIRMHQERDYPERVVGTAMVNPDFVTLARAYGLEASRVTKTEDFPAALEAALASPTGGLIELVTDPEQISVRMTLSKLREAALRRRSA